MTDHRFHDGVYHDARRNYRDCPRSWHVPAATPRTGFYVWTGVSLVVCCLPVILLGMLWS